MMLMIDESGGYIFFGKEKGTGDGTHSCSVNLCDFSFSFFWYPFRTG